MNYWQCAIITTSLKSGIIMLSRMMMMITVMMMDVPAFKMSVYTGVLNTVTPFHVYT